MFYHWRNQGGYGSEETVLIHKESAERISRRFAQTHMVTDINDVAIRNGHNSSKLKYAAHANGNISLSNIADVYNIVKGITREKGGWKLVFQNYFAK